MAQELLPAWTFTALSELSGEAVGTKTNERTVATASMNPTGVAVKSTWIPGLTAAENATLKNEGYINLRGQKAIYFDKMYASADRPESRWFVRTTTA